MKRAVDVIRLAVIILLSMVMGSAFAGPPPASLETVQRLGVSLPRGLELVDAQGVRVDWRAVAETHRPIVLLPAYYRCDTLCGTVAHGALEALADTGLPTSAWQMLVFSIDPADRPADAMALQNVYTRYAAWARPSVYASAAPNLRLLTGDAKNTRSLATAVGFRWMDEPGPNGTPDYAHATGLVVLTPDGVVSRYLPGVRFDPARLRSALVDAADGHVGTFADRLLLACSHFDPLLGAHDGAILASMRAIALLLMAGLGTWMWRHRASAAARRPARLVAPRSSHPSSHRASHLPATTPPDPP